jgi:spore coat protein U domain-containing protein, fimbrial subunit CupE1/2/3/6
MKRFVPCFLAILALFVLLSDAPVLAASTQGNLSVSASVTGACSVGVSTMTFGAYDPFGTTPLDVQGSVKYTCTKGTVITSITLDNGQNFSSSNRRMSDGGTNYLTYELYYDSYGGTVWNATTFPTGITVPNKSEQTRTVYGRVLAGQDLPAGNYNDTVRVTINY